MLSSSSSATALIALVKPSVNMMVAVAAPSSHCRPVAAVTSISSPVVTSASLTGLPVSLQAGDHNRHGDIFAISHRRGVGHDASDNNRLKPPGVLRSFDWEPSVAGDLPRDPHAVVREHFTAYPPPYCRESGFVLQETPMSSTSRGHRQYVVGEAHDLSSVIVVRCIGDRGVQLNADFDSLREQVKASTHLRHCTCNSMPPNSSVMPSARTVLAPARAAGETFLRLRHAAARHGEQYSMTRLLFNTAL